MINVERLTTVLQTVAVSGLVQNGNPISITLIAPSDSGKSQLISKTLPPDARVINDFTFASMASILNEDKPPTWIVVPDFNSVISHKPAVATLTMAFLLSLLAEGVTEIPGVDHDAKLKALAFRKKAKQRGIKIALLTGMTPDMFYSRRGKWRATGLLRRLVPVSYTYSDDTVDKIQQAIQQGLDVLDYAHQKQARIKTRPVEIPAGLIATEIKALSHKVVAEQLVWNHRGADGSSRIERGHDFPFTIHKVFRNYAKAAALLRGRTIVGQQDLKSLKDFSKFVRYSGAVEL